MAAKTIYLASPLGFSAESRTALLPRFVQALESLGLVVWEPFSRNQSADLRQCSQIQSPRGNIAANRLHLARRLQHGDHGRHQGGGHRGTIV